MTGLCAEARAEREAARAAAADAEGRALLAIREDMIEAVVREKSRVVSAWALAGYRVLAMVEANPTITQRALAAALGVSLGRVNYGLRALIDKGLIKVNNFKRSETKLNYAYLLTPSGVSEKSALTKAFLARKMQEFDALKKEIEALQLMTGDTDRLKNDNQD